MERPRKQQYRAVSVGVEAMKALVCLKAGHMPCPRIPLGICRQCPSPSTFYTDVDKVRHGNFPQSRCPEDPSKSFCEFEASLSDIVSSKPVWATE